MDQIQAEIEAINSQIKALRTERDALTSKEIVPENAQTIQISGHIAHIWRSAGASGRIDLLG